MASSRRRAELQEQLTDFLAERFDDVTVEIGDDIHYRGTNIVVTTAAFTGLLPEQRYHHVVRAVPPEFYAEKLASGFVWFELAPGETGEDYMKMPRSQDVAREEPTILRNLIKIGFFETLQTRADMENIALSIDDFTLCKDILKKAGFDADAITQTCLVLIRRGAFCDAHVLIDVAPKVLSESAA
jgi:hypothetical protein